MENKLFVEQRRKTESNKVLKCKKVHLSHSNSATSKISIVIHTISDGNTSRGIAVSGKELNIKVEKNKILINKFSKRLENYETYRVEVVFSTVTGEADEWKIWGEGTLVGSTRSLLVGIGPKILVFFWIKMKISVNFQSDLLRDGVKRLASTNNVVSFIIGSIIDGLELFGDLLDLSLGVRFSNQLTEVKILHWMTGWANLKFSMRLLIFRT